ncbi:MAG: HEPN domain-containing protein [Candidatus Sumerlaeaceae bacterium]|nr:HEPN domain-containing protein [Candidatus Sumerlaeaceae bacterium]
MDTAGQVKYWVDGAREDWEAAVDLVHQGRMRHGLFFAHLALEKALKAHVSLRTNTPPARIHNLVRLAQTAGLALTDDVMDLLADMNQFNLEGRYPQPQQQNISGPGAAEYMKRAGEVLAWLTRQL